MHPLHKFQGLGKLVSAALASQAAGTASRRLRTALRPAPSPRARSAREFCQIIDDGKVASAARTALAKGRRGVEIAKATPQPKLQRSITKAFNTMLREMVDAAIANCFYGNGISFRVVGYVLFNRMVDALMNAPPGYKTPTRQRLTTDLFESTRERIESAKSTSYEPMKIWSGSIALDAATVHKVN